VSGSVKRYPARTEAWQIEDKLHDMFDGEHAVVAVEIFDGGLVTGTDGELIGPWVLGPEEDVYAWLEDHGHVEYEEQHRLEMPSDD
jgi:hypothetical protein